MKFFETIRLPAYDAITSGRRTLSNALRPLRTDGGYEVQTSPFLPEDEEHILIEIEIADENIPSTAECIVYDTYDRHFLVTKSDIDHAAIRRVPENELLSIAKEELGLCMLPSSQRVGDAIAHCPKSKRMKRYGRWLMAVYDEWRDEQRAGR